MKLVINYIKTTSNGVKLYELTYLSLPGLSEDEQKTLLEKVVSVSGIQPVNQHSSGFFNTLDFNCEPEKIKEIEEKLKQEPQIKRYLIVKKIISRIRTRFPRRAEFSVKPEKKTAKSKVELQEIEKKLDEILK